MAPRRCARRSRCATSTPSRADRAARHPGGAASWVDKEKESGVFLAKTQESNGRAVRLEADTGGGSGPVELIKCARGRFTTLASDTYSTASPPYAVKVKVADADEASVQVEGGLEVSTIGVVGARSRKTSGGG